MKYGRTGVVEDRRWCEDDEDPSVKLNDLRRFLRTFLVQLAWLTWASVLWMDHESKVLYYHEVRWRLLKHCLKIPV